MDKPTLAESLDQVRATTREIKDALGWMPQVKHDYAIEAMVRQQMRLCEQVDTLARLVAEALTPTLRGPSV